MDSFNTFNDIKKIRCIIFDLDGTIWDCSKATVIGFNKAYDELEIPRSVDVDLIHYISGKPSSEYNHILFEGVPEDKDVRDELLRLFDKYEAEAVRREDTAKKALYEGVEDGLQKLKRNGFKLFVVSNCGKDYLNAFIECSGLRSYFEGFRCYEDFGKKKAENIIDVIREYHLEDLHPCYVGDTAADKVAAEKAGIPFFHAKYGFEPEFSVDKEHSFEDFSKLIECVTREIPHPISI